MYRATGTLLFIWLTLTLLSEPSPASDAGWKEIGFRAGANATGSVTIKEYELFTAYQFPWGLGSRSPWRLNTRMNGSLGFLHDGGGAGFLASLGPGISVERVGVPLELDGGISAAFLSQDTFGAMDLNGQVQFISHIGLNFRLGPHLGAGYNFQHMSNASMNGPRNPGLNMHMFSLHWYFR